MNGIFGLYTDRDCVRDIYTGTADLEHRGQEYGGMSITDGEKIKIRTHRGVFSRTFENDLDLMPGHFGIGNASSNDRQPIPKHASFGEYHLGFDGYIVNSEELHQNCMFDGHSFTSLEDIELLAVMIGRAQKIEEGIERAMTEVAGPCNLTVLTTDGIFAARGMHGWRPLVLGKNKHAWAVASETSAFNNETGLHRFRDLEPGEIVFIGENGLNVLKVLNSKSCFCSFEWIYFASPDSVIENISVTAVRHNLGRFLAQNDDIEADIVAPVVNSGIMHAEGYHYESGLPTVEVFLPLRYKLRTYIRPIRERKQEKSRKFRPIAENVRGKRLVLVDDSIRSGITTQGLITMLKDAGAKEVHVRIASPSSISDCRYDRPPMEEEKFIAALSSLEEIRRFIGADTLKYQELENVSRAIGLPEEQLCLDCFLKV